jgi:hypothetical protein
MDNLKKGTWRIRNDMKREGDITSSVERCVHLAYLDPAQGAVPNPGMGINAYVCSDHMHTGYTAVEWQASQSLPRRALDKASFDKLIALPQVDNLYIRVEWSDVQSHPGRLDLLPAWEWLMDAVQRHKKRWSFRVMNCSPHSALNHSLPDFLENRIPMAAYWRNGMPGPQPKYFSRYTAEYLKWWNELNYLLGAKFDGDPMLEYADVSGFGLWGEGHHYAMYTPDGPVVNYQSEPAEHMEHVVKQLIESHLGAFPKTPAVLSVHFTEYEAGRKAIEDGTCWMRSDSITQDFSTGETGASMLAARNGAMLWETVRPGCDDMRSETAAPEFFMGLPQRYFDVGAHYAAVGFNAWDAIYAAENYPELFTVLQSRIGYRIRPSMILRRSEQPGEQDIVLGLVNDGCATPPGVLEIQVSFPDGTETVIALPANEPAPGSLHFYAVELPASYLDAGPDVFIQLKMTIRIKGQVSPVRWAVKAEQRIDNYTLRIPLYKI